MIQSQLCMLTASIDSLIGQLSYVWHAKPNIEHLEPFDAEVQPVAAARLPADPAPASMRHDAAPVQTQIGQLANDSATQVKVIQEATDVTCEGCWDLLPAAYVCPAMHLCVDCAGYYGRANVAAKAFGDVVALLEQGTIQCIEFYDSCRTLVASGCHLEGLVVTVPTSALPALLETARNHNVHIRSHFSKHFIPDAVDESSSKVGEKAAGNCAADAVSEASTPEHALEDQADSHSARVNAMVEKFKDENVPQYSAEHMHEMIQPYAPIGIDQLSESPRWQGVRLLDGIAFEIVAKVCADFRPGDDNLYSKSQAREAFEAVTRLCGDAFGLVSEDHLHE